MASSRVVEIVEAFDAADHRRGYVCVAPAKICSPHITVDSGGVWFRVDPRGQLQSAHRDCLEFGR